VYVQDVNVQDSGLNSRSRLLKGGILSNNAQSNEIGFCCMVRGCPKKNNRRFNTMGGLTKHIISMHPGYLEKKLNAIVKKRPPKNK